MSHIFSALPILTLFVLGYLLKQVKFFRESTIVDIKKFVTNITLPALLFNAFLSLDIQVKYILLIVVVYLMCTIMIFIGTGVAKIATIKSPYFPLMMGGFEMGMFGYALFISLYGIEHLGKIAFLTIGQTIFVFTILISRIMIVQNGKQSIKSSLKFFFTSPIILSIVGGIIAGQLKGYVVEGLAVKAAMTFIVLLGSISIPLITITIGYGITIGREGLGISLFTILVRKSLLVVFALMINRYIIDGLLHMEAMYRYALLILALSPPSFILSIFIQPEDKENFSYINRTISLDCLISIFLTMIAASLY